MSNRNGARNLSGKPNVEQVPKTAVVNTPSTTRNVTNPSTARATTHVTHTAARANARLAREKREAARKQRIEQMKLQRSARMMRSIMDQVVLDVNNADYELENPDPERHDREINLIETNNRKS